jgi:A/G-specific adenine glycosylase
MASVVCIDEHSSDAHAAHAMQFTTALLAWYAGHGRKHLPWQRELSAYRVWVSEVMLQQTQVITVIPYYERFMTQYPDVHTLAAATIDEVLHLWTGLGYYARGRNLHRAAQQVVREFDGAFPTTLEAMQSLPGIGRSTAGAILAIAMSQRHPILDGNVKRVLTRYFGIGGFPGEAVVERQLWTLADICTPTQQVGNYTQAIMDLGATLCVRSRPLCHACPVAAGCVARQTGRQSELPTRRPRKERPLRESYAAILIRRDGTVLLEQRPATGLWGGLWAFPQFQERVLATEWLQQHGAGEALPQAAYRHAFTHYDLLLHPLLARIDTAAAEVRDGHQYLWYDAQQPSKIGLTKPVVDLIQRHVLKRPATAQGLLL